MALRKIKLGSVLIPFKEKCNVPNLSSFDVSGINKDKEFFEPSRQVASDTSNYQKVPPKYFACNLMHVGRDVVLPIAYNHTNKIKHVSPAYSVFKLEENCGLLDYYLFMFLKSAERDRMFWFYTDSSVRDGMSWEDFCEIEVVVPDIPTQQKYIDVYLSMVENQKTYDRGLEDLKLVCDGYIEDLRRKMHCEKIGPYIIEVDERNKDNKVTLLQGFCMTGDFIEPRRVSIDIPSLKILKNGELIYNRAVECVSDKFIVAIREGKTCAVSNSYIIFKSGNEEKLLNKYLLLWLKRTEFARYSKFKSHGTAHENFEFEDLCEVEIPIPTIYVQQSIVNVFQCYNERKLINEKLKQQIKDICPILIKGSIEECRNV